MLRALDLSGVLRDVITAEQLAPLLPAAGKPLEPITLLFQTRCCEAGDFDTARPVIARWQTEFARVPVWLAVDGLKQAAAFYALIDKDLARAEECLNDVKRLQLVPWYAELISRRALAPKVTWPRAMPRCWCGTRRSRSTRGNSCCWAPTGGFSRA